MKIVSKKLAKKLGLNRYFTGIECKNGHTAKRAVCGGACVECVRLANIKNKDKRTASAKRWKDANKARIKNTKKEWDTANKEYVKAYSARYNKKNPHQSGKSSVMTRTNKKGVPKWYDIEKELIRALYLKRDRLTKSTGLEHNIDHIVPICSDDVCGLHTLANLRIISEEENLNKSNKFDIPFTISL